MNKFCEKCGNKLNEEERFCSKCGKEVASPNSPDIEIKCGNCDYIGHPEPGRRKVFTILAWICVVFAPLITILYFVFTHKYKCPKCHSTFVAVKNKEGRYDNKKKGLRNPVAIILLVLVGIAALGIISSVVLASLNTAREKASKAKAGAYDQDLIASSVVNIICPGIREDLSDAKGGSGTIISTEGTILTNAHIIPQNRDEEPLSKLCVITLPNPKTGAVEETYVGTPIIVPYLSSRYDLALIAITEPYQDDEGNLYGSYSKVFPAFSDEGKCLEENVALGEQVRIFGYPNLSGGYSLTLTDGVVSALPGDGFIITSAKISSGNSGGLAVDRNGCMLGIPSMVSSDESESLGVITSTNLISEFIDKAEALNKLLE